MQGTVLLYQANRNKLMWWQTYSVLLKCVCKCVSVHVGGWCYIALYIFMASRNRHHRLKKKHFLRIIYSVYTINTNTQFCRELWVKELRSKYALLPSELLINRVLTHYQFLTKTYTQDDFSGLIIHLCPYEGRITTVAFFHLFASTVRTKYVYRETEETLFVCFAFSVVLCSVNVNVKDLGFWLLCAQFGILWIQWKILHWLRCGLYQSLEHYLASKKDS